MADGNVVDEQEAARQAAWRRERRRAARHTHPDLGGDLHEYLAAAAEIDARYGLGAGSVDVVGRRIPRPRARGGRRGPLRRARQSGRRVGKAGRSVATRLWRRLPGSRTYIELPARPDSARTEPART